MRQNILAMIILTLVVSTGAISVVGLLKDFSTGATVTRTSSVRGRNMCCCSVERFDFSGNSIGTEIHNVKASSRGGHTDAGCLNRCDLYFGSNRRARRQINTAYAC